MITRRTHLRITRLLGLAAFAAVGFTLSVDGQVHTDSDWWGEPSVEVHNFRTSEMPHNIPTWTKADAKAHPNCHPGDPATAGLSDYLVVLPNADRVEMTFGEVWDRGQDDNRANDIWVVGLCN